jgi:hypothetical protein
MLIAIFVTMLLGGGSTAVMDYLSDTRQNVKTVIVDEDRRSSAFTTLKIMKKRSAAMNKQAARSGKQLDKALRDHDGSAEVIEAIWSDYFEAVDEFNSDMIDLRFELKDSVTREEWEQLFGE